MPQYNVAIIGTGKIAGTFADKTVSPATHAAAIATNPQLELKAVCEPDKAKAQEFGKKWDVSQQFSSVAELQEAAPFDIVAICTPDATHAAMIEELLGWPTPPKLVVCEKPLCLKRTEMERIEHALNGHSTAITINHTRRFDATHKAVQAMIAERKLGAVVSARFAYYGGWLHNGVHGVDTLAFLLGAPLKPVRFERGFDGHAGDPCVDGKFMAGIVPVLVESYPEEAFQLFEFEIRCQNGRIRMHDFGFDVWIDEVRTNDIAERELKHSYPLEIKAQTTPMQNLYHEAVAFLGNDAILFSDFASAKQTMETLFNVTEKL